MQLNMKKNYRQCIRFFKQFVFILNKFVKKIMYCPMSINNNGIQKIIQNNCKIEEPS